MVHMVVDMTCILRFLLKENGLLQIIREKPRLDVGLVVEHERWVDLVNRPWVDVLRHVEEVVLTSRFGRAIFWIAELDNFRKVCFNDTVLALHPLKGPLLLMCDNDNDIEDDWRALDLGLMYNTMFESLFTQSQVVPYLNEIL